MLVWSAIQNNLTVITTSIIAIIILQVDFSNKHWNKPSFVIENDVKSYYVYLPAVIIYKDLSLDFADQNHEKFKSLIWPAKTKAGNRTIITTMGLSFVYLPFFLATHSFALLSTYEADGYSTPYRFALMMACLFYLIIGLIFLSRILSRYFNQYITSITLIIIALGTNLFMYTTYRDAPMTHVFNFTLITIFIYSVIKWHEHQSYKNTIIIGLVSGLIALIRPTNILILLILFLYNIRSFKDIKIQVTFFLHNYKKVFLMVVLFLFVWTPQLIYWKYISGHFFYFTYKDVLGEGFFFNNPQVFRFLFSYQKGWLLYTPIMTMAIIGIPILYFKMRQFFTAILIFLLASIYILSSWWCWWYGGSFGMRSMIDLYGILAIPMAAFLDYFLRQKKLITYFTTAILIVLICLNLFQGQQYKNGVIHWEWMTKDAYWYSFFKYNLTEEGYSLMRLPNHELAKKGIYVDISTYEVNKEILNWEEKLQEIKTYLIKYDLKKIKDKAEKRGISQDSILTLDAIWIHNKTLEKQE